MQNTFQFSNNRKRISSTESQSIDDISDKSSNELGKKDT